MFKFFAVFFLSFLLTSTNYWFNVIVMEAVFMAEFLGVIISLLIFKFVILPYVRKLVDDPDNDYEKYHSGYSGD